MKCIHLVEFARLLPGGSRPYLMKAVDHQYYVVKFRDNPQGTTVLANELLASGLARLIGLPSAEAVVVNLDGKLLASGVRRLRNAHDSSIHLEQSGLHVGLRYAIDPLQGRVYDFLPMSYLKTIRNLSDFWGAYLFDCWTHNLDRRQAVYWRTSRQKKFSVRFIDNGHCFGGDTWLIPAEIKTIPRSDHPAFSVLKYRPDVIERWLSRIEKLSPTSIWKCASVIPREWYVMNTGSLEKVIDTLIKRQHQLRFTIESLLTESKSSRSGKHEMRNIFESESRHCLELTSASSVQ